MKNEPLVSIIIPTHNSEGTLAKCLESVRKQTYKNIEIIVVDKFSKDRTSEIAKSFGARVILKDLERSGARNEGIKKAKGTYILSIDSDMKLSPRVIKECLEAIKNEGRVGAVVIPEVSLGDSFWVKVRDFERSFYLNTEIESARFFRKDLVDKVGGYDTDITFLEEATLPQKIEALGFDVRKRVDAVIMHLEYDFSICRWLKKKYQYGKTGWLYFRRYSSYAARQTGLLNRLRIFLKDRRFYSKPDLAFGVLALKSLEYAAAGLGFLVAKIRGDSKALLL
jgi:glycosyltransferase involved in cell wall biosynthesis